MTLTADNYLRAGVTAVLCLRPLFFSLRTAFPN